MAQWMLDLEPNLRLDAQDNEGSTPLHMACLRGQSEIGRWLLAQGSSVLTGRGPQHGLAAWENARIGADVYKNASYKNIIATLENGDLVYASLKASGLRLVSNNESSLESTITFFGILDRRIGLVGTGPAGLSVMYDMMTAAPDFFFQL
jgi:ankyrin repeat protein